MHRVKAEEESTELIHLISKKCRYPAKNVGFMQACSLVYYIEIKAVQGILKKYRYGI